MNINHADVFLMLNAQMMDQLVGVYYNHTALAKQNLTRINSILTNTHTHTQTHTHTHTLSLSLNLSTFQCLH